MFFFFPQHISPTYLSGKVYSHTVTGPYREFSTLLSNCDYSRKSNTQVYGHNSFPSKRSSGVYERGITAEFACIPEVRFQPHILQYSRVVTTTIKRSAMRFEILEYLRIRVWRRGKKNITVSRIIRRFNENYFLKKLFREKKYWNIRGMTIK